MSWINKNNLLDAVKHCEQHQQEGCAHVGGFLCDFPECEMRQKFLNGFMPADCKIKIVRWRGLDE